MIIETILKINPDAKVIVRGNDIDNCEIEWLEDTTPISKEDIKAMMPTVEAEKKEENNNLETNKASGKQKLKDLGLNDAEIKALIGV
jgi:septal ring factor EnvC (AmiA/AmiB activator)|tara:strand:+ start:161 stop:421 length:261 start_codon:yes stop_codon:yes gene_type:complete